MHTFFDVLGTSLAGQNWAAHPETIQFVVGVLEPLKVTVRLEGKNCRVLPGESEEAALTVHCDSNQLDSLLEQGFTVRPLRVHGRRELLGQMVDFMKPGGSPLSIRAGDAS